MPQPVIMGGVPFVHHEIAGTVALEAIWYMDNWENMVIEDLNYSDLRYVDAKNHDLHERLQAVKEYRQRLHKGLLLPRKAMVSVSHWIYDFMAQIVRYGKMMQTQR